MDAWLENIVRQFILYSLPVLVSLTVVSWCERRPADTSPFHAIAWWGAWLPWALSTLFHRGVVFALPQPASHGARGAARRLGGHLALLAAGWLLYRLSLAHPPAAGLPPLHHWWAKVLMYFNLCMACMHLLPLPGMLSGEWLAGLRPGRAWAAWLGARRQQLLIALLAATPMLDATLGAWLIFPVYETLASLAAKTG